MDGGLLMAIAWVSSKFHAKSRRFAESSKGLDDEMLLQKGGK